MREMAQTVHAHLNHDVRRHGQLLVTQTRRCSLLQNRLALDGKSRLFCHSTLQKGLQEVDHTVVLEGAD